MAETTMTLEEQVADLSRRLDAAEVLAGDTATDLADLYDLMGHRLTGRKEFDKNRRTLEDLLSNAFDLPDVKLSLLSARKMQIHVRPNRTDLNGNIRRAQLLMLYLLIKHDSYASRRRLEPIYNFNPRWLMPLLHKLVIEERGFKEKMERVERELMNQMGLTDHPLLPLPDGMVVSSRYKDYCKREKIDYYYRDVPGVND